MAGAFAGGGDAMGGEHVGRRFIVAGKVQGVFFRASAAREATRLGVRGHALNLADGRVEVLAIGTPAAVEALQDWLRRGPPSARVDSVEVTVLMMSELGAVGGFRTG